MRTPPSPFEAAYPRRPHPARIFNYFLGGFHHFAVDRHAAEAARQIYPDLPLVARVNRAFLRRVVTCLLEHGITQFLDLGSGLPALGCTHEVALARTPTSRVVYVDSDPLTVAHGRQLVQELGTTTMVQADLPQMAQILSHPEVQRLLDVRQPIGVLLLTRLMFVPSDAAAEGLIQRLRAALAPGSYVALAHPCLEHLPTERVQALQQLTPLFARAPDAGTARSRAAIARFFTGLELLAPGLVYLPCWHPEGPDDLFVDQPERSLLLGGVGRKRA